MEVKCLLTASLAILACHPKTTIKCFTTNKSRVISPQRAQRPIASEDLEFQPRKVPKKKENADSNKKFSVSACCSDSKAITITIPPNTEKLSNAVKELRKGGHSASILEKIIRSGWPNGIALRVKKVFKINHSAEVIYKFEESREKIKSSRITNGEKMGKLMTDGNEVRGFIGTTITCSLGVDGKLTTCENKCCGFCRMIGCSLKVGKKAITFYENAWKAHQRVRREGAVKGSCVRTAVVVCRVIAGRVARYHKHGFVDRGEDVGVDSVVRSTGALEVFNPRAFLPCCAVIYEAKL